MQDGDGPLFSLTRAQESELPGQVNVSFIDPLQDYRQASVSSRRLAGASRHMARARLAVVAPANVMARAADVWLQDLWAGRESVQFTLPPSALALMPGDVVRLSLDGRARVLGITRVEEAEARVMSARSIEPEVFDAPLDTMEGGEISVPQELGPPDVQLLDLPARSASEPLPLQYVAASVSPWPGTLAVWRSIDGGSFEALVPLNANATFGVLLEPLKRGPFWRFDHFNSVMVQLASSVLHSASTTQVLGGANALALMAPGREPEILQFTEAELVDERSYRLTGLLRGLAGTEAAGMQDWPEGTRLLLLDGAVVPVAQGLGELGHSYVYRVGPVSEDHGGENVRELRGEVGPRALLPLSPVHLRAKRSAGGVVVSFIRRTRLDGDSWYMLDVPLGEAQERYRIEVLRGNAVVLVFETAAPTFTYRDVDELADFGAVQLHLTFRVVQISQSVGAGAALTSTVMV